MTSPESGENAALGYEMLVGVNIVTADVLLRSGLPADITYSSVSLSRLHTPDEEISLDIRTDTGGGYIISYSESRRMQDREEEVFELGLSIDLRLQKDGHGLGFNYEDQAHSKSLAEETEYLIRRLPDFDGAEATIEVLVPEAK